MHALRFIHGALLALTLAGTAAAQPKSEVDKSIALAHEARRLYDAGDWSGALEKFRAAETIAHSPVLVLHVARCLRNLGQLVTARRHYAEVATAPTEGAPPPVVQARRDAEAELAALEPRIPRLSVRVEASPPGTTLHVDDVAIGVGEERLVDPGPHRVELRVAGVVRAQRVVDVREGDPPRIVDLPIAESAPTTPGAPLPPPAAVVPPPPGEDDGSLVPGAIVTSIGGAGLVFGGVMGAVALAVSSDVKSRCRGTICDPADADARDAIDTYATMSTIGFVAGGVTAAVGIVLLIVRPGGGEAQVAVRLSPAPGGVGLSGRF